MVLICIHVPSIPLAYDTSAPLLCLAHRGNFTVSPTPHVDPSLCYHLSPPLNGNTPSCCSIMACLHVCSPLLTPPIPGCVSPSKARPRSYLYIYPQHFIQGLAHWMDAMIVYWTKLNYKHNAKEVFILSAKKEKLRIRKGFTGQVTLELGLEKWKDVKEKQ